MSSFSIQYLLIGYPKNKLHRNCWPKKNIEKFSDPKSKKVFSKLQKIRKSKISNPRTSGAFVNFFQVHYLGCNSKSDLSFNNESLLPIFPVHVAHLKICDWIDWPFPKDFQPLNNTHATTDGFFGLKGLPFCYQNCTDFFIKFTEVSFCGICGVMAQTA